MVHFKIFLCNFIFYLNNTSLHLAVEMGSIEIAKLLLQVKGIDKTIKDNVLIFMIKQCFKYLD